MRADFEILQDLIKTKALASIVYEYNKKAIVLKEPGHQQRSAYSLRIHNVPEEIIAFKADVFPAPRKIFKGEKGECKRADFIIIAGANKANWIVYIEMTSGKGGSKTKKDIEQQLRGAQCLLAYCRAIGQEFWQEPKFLEQRNYQSRFVSVRDIGISKQANNNTARIRSTRQSEGYAENQCAAQPAIQKTGRKILIHHSNRDVRTWSYNCISIDTELALSSCRVS